MSIKGRIQETNKLIFTGWMSEVQSDAIDASWIVEEMKMSPSKVKKQ